MYSYDEFLDLVDNLVSPQMTEALNNILPQYEAGEFGMLALTSLLEKFRVQAIKEHISKTHKWHLVNRIDESGFITEAFWCKQCNIKASRFEHLSALSTISKVKDNLPTYTCHNKYLMFMCGEVVNLAERQPGRCVTCGIPSKVKSDECKIHINQ